MAKKLIENEMGSFSVRYRAVCEDDSFRGSWRNNVDDAYADARNHRQGPGNNTHVIRIVSEQSVSMRFVE